MDEALVKHTRLTSSNLLKYIGIELLDAKGNRIGYAGRNSIVSSRNESLSVHKDTIGLTLLEIKKAFILK